MAKTFMYFRLLAAAFANRGARTATMLASIVICSAVVSGAAFIYSDIGTRVGGQLRSYGANVAAVPVSPDKFISVSSADKAALSYGDRLKGYSPFLYARVNLGRSQVVAVGTRLTELKNVSPYLKITGRGEADASTGTRAKALVGRGLARKLSLNLKDKVNLTFGARGKIFEVGGFVESGDVEEDQVFVDLKPMQALLGQPGAAGLAYYSVLNESGRTADLISGEFNDDLRFEPVARVAAGESRILMTVRALIFSVAGIVLITGALTVATTMVNNVRERGREIGLKKALGADDRDIRLEFIGEGLALGIAGGFLGCLVGFAAAQWIARTVFQDYVSFNAVSMLIAVGTALGTTLAAMSAPVFTAFKIEPASVLKGE